jgi:hypothetical protein
MIQQGWREQYARMKRSHAHLRTIASGENPAGSDTARDALFHFFQDAYHLKDWLKNDDAAPVDASKIEEWISRSTVLTACADLCNGTKHRKFEQPMREGKPKATFVSQSVNVHVPTGEASAAEVIVASVGPAGSELAPGSTVSVDAESVWGPTGLTTHRWTVRTADEDFDAEQLAQLVQAEWDQFLTQHGLVT